MRGRARADLQVRFLGWSGEFGIPILAGHSHYQADDGVFPYYFEECNAVTLFMPGPRGEAIPRSSQFKMRLFPGSCESFTSGAGISFPGQSCPFLLFYGLYVDMPLSGEGELNSSLDLILGESKIQKHRNQSSGFLSDTGGEGEVVVLESTIESAPVSKSGKCGHMLHRVIGVTE